MATPYASRFMGTPSFLAALPVGIVALALVASGCEKSNGDCDRKALEALATKASKTRSTLDEENTSRRAVADGITTACPTTPKWMAKRLNMQTESSADLRAQALASEDFEALRAQGKALRTKVCPDHADVLPKLADAAPEARGKLFWEGCNLARHGLYSFPSSMDERSPNGLLDFMVFQFLLDDGVPKETARAVARGLGSVASLSRAPPPAD